MSTMTEHYGLEMPLGSDYYDINVQNQNMEKIDAALWGLDEGKVGREDKGKEGGVASLDDAGQLPYAQAPHLTANVALYVSPTGNDDNPGTQQAPFKTIQAAVDSLPRDLGNFAVTILLAEGTYDEDVTISGFVGGAPYYAFSIRTESAEHTESCQVKSIRIINCVPMVQMKWFSITGTGQQAAAIEVEGSTAWLDGMILQYQGDVGTTSGVLAGSYGQATVRMDSSSIEGYRWGFRNCQLGKSSLNTCKISNCTTGAYAVESIMFLVNMTYTGNQTDKQRENYAQIYDSTNPN